MCGIAAIVGNGKQDKDELTKMLTAISHRGEAKYFNESAEIGTCVLGMNRLAIIDREQSRQPIRSNDGRYSIVFNGEIYNYKELQKELIEKGFHFRTDSDTEVLVNGYAAWGADLLLKLIGMFAFFIFDQDTGSFFAARDLFGVKPLYFAHDDSQNYYFASEIKSLSLLDRIEEVKLFPPAHYMKDGKLFGYWKIPTKIDENIFEEEAVIKIRELFDDAIRKRVQTDLPIAVYMSGGIDSTAVLATARKYHSDVTAIIVGNEESSDKKIAVRYCEENKIKYIVKTPPNEEELIKNIQNIVRITESFEPNMVRQSSISYYIAEAAAEKGFKVILCGEGSDEIFAGYPEFTKLETDKERENKIGEFLSDLHRTQLQRVDRTSMAFTTEVREPFLDRNLVEYVLKIKSSLKVRDVGGKLVTKYILRKAMEDRLPEYIFNRDKVVLSEGAGYKGNQKIGGLFYDIVADGISDAEFVEYKKKYSEWNLETKEEVYYFKYYLQFGYDKARFNQKRTTVNKIDTRKKTVSAEDIVKAFNTWKYKREQPSNVNKLVEFVEDSISKKRPIQFCMYWGKGDRDTIGEPEKRTFDFLNEFFTGINAVYPFGIEVVLIFTDTHAKLNGYGDERIKSYFDSVKSFAEKFKYKFTYLGDLVSFNEKLLSSQIDSLQMGDALLNQLVEASSKHYMTSQNYVYAAKMYYLQNQLEKKALEKEFADHIFITFNGSEFSSLFPENLPILHMYSLETGTSVKPWFLD